jgi:hypothetical protein
VPPRAILPYILHYTEPGDIILDPFCGSGMTGVAAMMCAEPPRDILEMVPGAKKGARRAVLNDLSPAACHIAYNYCTPVDPEALRREFERIERAVKAEFDWLYVTEHYEPAVGVYHPGNPEVAFRLKNPLAEVTPNMLLALPEEGRAWELLDRSEVELRLGAQTATKIVLPPEVNQFICIPACTQYTIWSDAFRCQGSVTILEPTGKTSKRTGKESVRRIPRARGCGGRFALWDVAVNKDSGEVRETFACPLCGQEWKKIQLKRCGITPVVTNYSYRGLTIRRKGKQSVVVESQCRDERPVSARERDRISESARLIGTFPLLRDCPMWTDGPQYRRNALGGRGIRSAADFYTDRSHAALAILHRHIQHAPPGLQPSLRFCLTAVGLPMTRMYAYRQNRRGGS